jgi:hypothetical protein
MPLSRFERRELRRLGRAAAAEDPALARLLRGPGPVRSGIPVVRSLAWAFCAAATAMLAAGAIIGDVGLLAGAGLLLVSLPPTLFITAAALKLEPPTA